MAESKLKLLLDLEDNVSKELDKTADSIKNVEEKTSNLQDVFGKVAAVGTAGFAILSTIAVKSFADFTASAEDTNRANIALQNTLDSMSSESLAELNEAAGLTSESLYGIGDSAGGAGESLTGLSESGGATGETMEYLQEVMAGVSESAVKLGIDDEEASLAFAKLFSASGDVNQALSDLKTAEDLAAYSGQDLSSAAQALISVHGGKATVLRQFGINVSEVATAEEALNLVHEKTKGSAEAMVTPIKTLKVEMGNLSEAIGASLAPQINALMTTLIPIVKAFGDWAGQNPTTASTILTIAGALFSLMTIIGTIGVVIGPISAGFAAIGGVIATMGVAITGVAVIFSGLAIPIAIAVGAIASLIAVGVLLYNNWDAVVQFGQTAWTSIGTTISNTMSSISSAVSSAWQTIQNVFWLGADFVIGAWALVLDFLFPGWDSAMLQVYTSTVSKFEMVKNSIMTAITFITGWIKNQLDNFMVGWNLIWDNVKTVFENAWNGIKSIAETVFTWINNGINTMMGPINQLIGYLNQIINLAQTVMNSVSSAIGSTVSTIIGRGASITGRASGGSVTSGTPYIVGEAGPELFVPGRSGSIIPNGNIAGNGGQTFVINISGTFADDRDSAMRMGNELVKYLKDNFNL